MFLPNTGPDHGRPLPTADAEFVGVEAARDAERFLAGCPIHAPTTLRALPGLAARLDIASLHVKDEAERLGLGSFKALGGCHAVLQLVLERGERELGRPLPASALLEPALRRVAARLTFACATAGNHGRSVAAGARLAGARAVIFVPENAAATRVEALRRAGADVIPVDGSYDDAVGEATRRCERNGWILVSDTSWSSDERVPGLVMQGYTVLAQEALRQLPHAPTHVFIQAGVGGLAAAVFGALMDRLGGARPRCVVVEPAGAACIAASARAGRAVRVEQPAPTSLTMLDCHEPSPVAWRILSRCADAFMTIADEDALRTMRELARPADGDPPIVSDESGCAGLAGLRVAAADADMRLRLELDERARVLVVNTEGAPDPRRYAEQVGVGPEELRGEPV